MKAMWLNNSFFLRSEKGFGFLMVINTIILIAMLAVMKGERPLFLYRNTQGQLKNITVEYVSYHIKTTVSLNSTIIYCKDNSDRVSKLILGYVLENDSSIKLGKEVKAWYYTIKGNKFISQLEIDHKLIKKHNEKTGYSVFIVGLITMILEVFMIKHYKQNWPK